MVKTKVFEGLKSDISLEGLWSPRVQCSLGGNQTTKNGEDRQTGTK